MNVKGFLCNLFVFTKKIVPSEEHNHFELLENVNKHLDKDVEIIVSRITFNDIPNQECFDALMRLHKMGHVYVMEDTNFIALNVYTKNNPVLFQKIIDLIENPESNIPKPQMCYNITHARYLDLAWNMTHQIQRYLEHEEMMETVVKVARFNNGRWEVRKQTWGDRLALEGEPWYEQVYKTPGEQIEFMYFSDHLKQVQEVEEGVTPQTKELYEVAIVRESVAKRETSLVLVS